MQPPQRAFSASSAVLIPAFALKPSVVLLRHYRRTRHAALQVARSHSSTVSALTQALTCSDVHVVYARGSGEDAGLGITGTPFVASLASKLPDKSVTSCAVNYTANLAQTSAGPGATNMTGHLVAYAASCPKALFVIGGYSQGASVTDIAIGIPTLLDSGETIPTSLAPRIKAVVTFGNPLRLYYQTIASASPLYGPKSIDVCNLGDPVCNAGFTYHLDGSVTSAATQAAAKVIQG